MDIQPTWTTATLDKLLDLVIDYRGKTPKKLGGIWQDSGIPAVSAKNVKNGRFVRDDTIKYVSSWLYAKWMKHELEAGDILLTSEAPLGQTLFLKQKMQLVLSQRLFALRVNQRIITPRFLCYFLESEMGQSELHSRATGATAQGIRQSLLMDVAITFPPLPTQGKITAILSAYDDLIENNLRRIKILEEMAQNLYREWFVKFRFPGHQHARFTDSPLGRIPEGWDVVPLGQLADQVRDGVTPDSVDPETPYFGLEHLPRKSIALSDWGIVSEVQSTKLLFKKGDILFGKIRPYFHKIGVAPVQGVCSSDTIVIRSRSEDWFGLVLGCTSSSEFVEHATATSQGTKMPRANWDILVQYEVPLPPQRLLDQFNGFMGEMANQLHNFIFRNRNLRRTRDLLLPRLISGEVDVSELDIVVPEEAEA